MSNELRLEMVARLPGWVMWPELPTPSDQEIRNTVALFSLDRQPETVMSDIKHIVPLLLESFPDGILPPAITRQCLELRKSMMCFHINISQ